MTAQQEGGLPWEGWECGLLELPLREALCVPALRHHPFEGFVIIAAIGTRCGRRWSTGGRKEVFV